MTIGENHLLSTASLQLIAGGAPMVIRRCVVIHFTSGASAKSTINYWRSPESQGRCAHLVIDRNGALFQCRPFSYTAGHAGTSRWQDPKTGHRYVGLNSCSIGVELCNAGNNKQLAERNSNLPLLSFKHRNGQDSGLWEQYPEAQLATCFRVVKTLVRRYNLDDVTGHDCIAPERKIDPGPAFPMLELREACGFHGLPKIHHG
jgi:N-acetylmuramoyl-L-alanine amidase